MFAPKVWRTEGEGGGVGTGAGGEGGAPPKTPAAGDMVPRSRLNEVLGEVRTLKREMQALEPKVKGYDELTAAKTAWETERAALTERVALARSGIVDDDHEAALRSEWGKLPDEARKDKTLADFWNDVKATEADKVPRILRGFLDLPAASSAADPTKPPRTPTQPGTKPGTDTEDTARRTHADALNAYTKHATVDNLRKLTEATAALEAAVAARKARS